MFACNLARQPNLPSSHLGCLHDHRLHCYR